jgi:uncharacterized protein
LLQDFRPYRDRETHDKHRRQPNGEGSYDKIIEWIPYLKAHQKWLGARVTPSPDTVQKLAGNIRFLRRLGINQFLIGLAAGQGWTSQMLEVYRHQWEEIADFYIAERNEGRAIRITEFERSWETLAQERANLWGCSAGRVQIAIAPDGRVYPCSKFMTGLDPFTGGRGAYQLGNLDEGITRLDYRHDITNAYKSCRIACLRCEFSTVCCGSCLAVNYEENDSVFDCRGNLCDERKIIYDLIRRRPDICTAGNGKPMSDTEPDSLHFQPIGEC